MLLLGCIKPIGMDERDYALTGFEHPSYSDCTVLISTDFKEDSMESAYCAVNEVEGNVFLLARAQIIDELETTVPRALRKPSWEPRYIHFLQVLSLYFAFRANLGFRGRK